MTQDARTVKGVPGVCKDMQVIAKQGCVFSAWRPTPEEMQLLNEGAFVWLTVRGDILPVVTVIVGTQSMVVPPGRALLGSSAPRIAEEFTPLGLQVRRFAYWLLSL